MNIDPNKMNARLDVLKDKAREFGGSPLGKQVVSGVEGMAKKKLHDVKRAADASGLGGVVDIAVNLAEDKVRMDLDGDGDIGK